MNFGLEVWLEHFERDEIYCGDSAKVYPAQALPRQKRVTYLGYCNVDDGWQLAVKRGTLIEDWDRDEKETFKELVDVSYQSLLKASREERVAALRLVPRLLDEIKRTAEYTIRDIDEADRVAEKL